MRVERTLIALGLVLALAGLLVAYNGYVYVNVDRGPPMMVSGVLTFGFGLVIAALGFAVRELQAISADASKVALLLAKNRSAAFTAGPAQNPAPLQKPLPPHAPFETPPAAPKDFETAPEETAADGAQSDLFPIDAKPEKRRNWLFSRKPASRTDDRARFGARAASPLSWMAKPGQADESATKPEDDRLDQAVAAEADTAPGEELAVEPAFGPGKTGDDGKPAETAPRRSDISGSDISRSDISRGGVMGHYEAHGAHYTMYADGSIEAETQHGVYRFASIEELKRFIEGEDSGDVTAKG